MLHQVWNEIRYVTLTCDTHCILKILKKTLYSFNSKTDTFSSIQKTDQKQIGWRATPFIIAHQPLPHVEPFVSANSPSRHWELINFKQLN
jgi:hypothetical protein